MLAEVAAAATPPPAPSTEAAANWAEPAKVVADMTTAATASKPAVPERTPNDAPKAAAATAIGAIRLAPSLYPLSVRDPVTREVEPEGEARVAAVRAEA